MESLDAILGILSVVIALLIISVNQRALRKLRSRRSTRVAKPSPAIVFVSYPLLFSKRKKTQIFVHLCPPDERESVRKRSVKGNEEQEYGTHILVGRLVTIELESPQIVFTKPRTLSFEPVMQKVVFVARPSDDCDVGINPVKISIYDKETNCSYLDEVFEVKVVDFIFDHISRPLLSYASSAVLGIGSLATFILTLFDKVDTAFGLTAGTAAAVTGAFIAANALRLFYRVKTTVHLP